MPLTIKTNALKYRKSDGSYSGIDSIAESSTAEQVAAIEAAGTSQTSAIQQAGTNQVASIQQKGTETLNSIPNDYTELSNEVDGLRSALNDIIGDIKPLSDYDQIRGNINSSGNWTGVSSGSAYHILVPIEPSDALVVTCSATTNNIIAFLKSNVAPVHGAAADFSEETGFTSRIQLVKSSVNTYIVPDDAHYLYLYVATDMPSISINGINIDASINTLIVDAYKGAQENSTDIERIDGNINGINSSLDFHSISYYPQTSGLISSTGEWVSIDATHTHIAVPVSSGQRILVVGNEDNTSQIAFLRTYSASVSGAADFSTETGYNARIQLNKGSYNWYDVPTDAAYMYILILNGANNTMPKEIRINNVCITKGIFGNFEDLYCPAPVNWCAMGDSITSSYHSDFVDGEPVTSTDDREDIAWAYLVRRWNRWNLTNIAIGGTGYLDEGAGRSGWKVARETDFTPYNLVTISYGCNDWKGNCVIGSLTDDGSAETPTTVIQAMKATIEAIMASNPACKIIVITPLNLYGYSKDYGDKSTNYGLGYAFSNSGTLDSFCNALISVCEYYGIQYIDMTHNSPINRENLPVMLPDGVHPSTACHNLIAHQLSKQITF